MQAIEFFSKMISAMGIVLSRVGEFKMSSALSTRLRRKRFHLVCTRRFHSANTSNQFSRKRHAERYPLSRLVPVEIARIPASLSRDNCVKISFARMDSYAWDGVYCIVKINYSPRVPRGIRGTLPSSCVLATRYPGSGRHLTCYMMSQTSLRLSACRGF